MFITPTSHHHLLRLILLNHINPLLRQKLTLKLLSMQDKKVAVKVKVRARVAAVRVKAKAQARARLLKTGSRPGDPQSRPESQLGNLRKNLQKGQPTNHNPHRHMYQYTTPVHRHGCLLIRNPLQRDGLRNALQRNGPRYFQHGDLRQDQLVFQHGTQHEYPPVFPPESPPRNQQNPLFLPHLASLKNHRNLQH